MWDDQCSISQRINEIIFLAVEDQSKDNQLRTDLASNRQRSLRRFGCTDTPPKRLQKKQ